MTKAGTPKQYFRTYRFQVRDNQGVSLGVTRLDAQYAPTLTLEAAHAEGEPSIAEKLRAAEWIDVVLYPSDPATSTQRRIRYTFEAVVHYPIVSVLDASEDAPGATVVERVDLVGTKVAYITEDAPTPEADAPAR